MEDFFFDYFILVFVASLGVLQMVAAYSGLRGLLLIGGRRASIVLGLLLTAAAFLWFFLSKPRNIPDTEAGLDGNQQTVMFAAGAGVALIFTLVASSLRNHRMGRAQTMPRAGLEALREMPYLHALCTGIRKTWGRWCR